MGGFRIEGYSGMIPLTAEKSPSTPSMDTRLTVDVLNFHGFDYIMKHFPDIIPDIPDESITDRADSSSLSKALLFVQVGWFCMNCGSRLFLHFPLSLLEVSTTAHAASTLLVYLLWWSKPFNIAEGKRIKGQKAREVHGLLKCSLSEYREALNLAERIAAGDSPIHTKSNERVTLAANALKHLLPTPEAPPRVVFRLRHYSSRPGSGSTRSTSHQYYYSAFAAISPILYGLIHCLAWNDKFPTPLEHLFWRISSVVVMFSGLTWSTSMIVGKYLDDLAPKYAIIMRVIIKVIVGALAILASLLAPLSHVLASGFLVVESFRQLFFLAPAVYQLPSWSNYWPHLS
jgi:hypothetical protein